MKVVLSRKIVEKLFACKKTKAGEIINLHKHKKDGRKKLVYWFDLQEEIEKAIKNKKFVCKKTVEQIEKAREEKSTNVEGIFFCEEYNEEQIKQRNNKKKVESKSKDYPPYVPPHCETKKQETTKKENKEKTVKVNDSVRRENEELKKQVKILTEEKQELKQMLECAKAQNEKNESSLSQIIDDLNKEKNALVIQNIAEQFRYRYKAQLQTNEKYLKMIGELRRKNKEIKECFNVYPVTTGKQKEILKQMNFMEFDYPLDWQDYCVKMDIDPLKATIGDVRTFENFRKKMTKAGV